MNDRPVLFKVKPYSRFDETFGIVTVSLLLLSLHLQALCLIRLSGGINVSLTDLSVIVLGYVWFIHAWGTRFHITKSLLTALALASLFAVWVGIEAFRSPEPVRGFTMFLLMLRDVAILWLVGSALGSIRDLQQLNKVVFLIGVVVAILSVATYLPAILDYHIILNNQAIWRPQVTYILGQAGILRLQGFAGDPNFYSLWMSISLCSGFVVKVRKFWKWLGIVVIVLSIIFTLPRGFFVAFLGAFLLIAFWLSLIHIKPLWRKYVRPGIMTVIALGIITIIPLPTIQESAARLLIARFQLTTSTPRFEMWKVILSGLPNHFLLGHGLRTTEQVLGGMYTHNSYLGLLFETGLIGLIFFVLFALFITIQGFSRRKVEFLPWLHVWVATLFMFLFFSLSYNPFPWLVAGVIVGTSKSKY